MQNMEVSTERTLLTVRQLASRQPAFSEGSLRYLIFCAKPRQSSRGTIPGNGLHIAIVRVGRRVLLDPELFQMWARSTVEDRLRLKGSVASSNDEPTKAADR